MNKFSKYISDIPDTHIDALLFALIAWFVFSQAYLGGDEAAKYMTGPIKFWINFIVGSGASIAGALKMYRSTGFAKHKADKEITSGSTTQITTIEEVKKIPNSSAPPPTT